MSSGRKRSLSGPATSDSEMEALQEQFMDYQLAPKDDLPKCDDDNDIELFWGEICNVKGKRFNLLSKLAMTLLVLPNSNVDCERAFSIVKK